MDKLSIYSGPLELIKTSYGVVVKSKMNLMAIFQIVKIFPGVNMISRYGAARISESELRDDQH